MAPLAPPGSATAVTSAHPEPVSWTSGLLYIRARLHQATESALQQLCNETSDTILIENNGVTPDWGCNPFSLVSSQSCCSVDADAWYKRVLT